MCRSIVNGGHRALDRITPPQARTLRGAIAPVEGPGASSTAREFARAIGIEENCHTRYARRGGAESPSSQDGETLGVAHELLLEPPVKAGHQVAPAGTARQYPDMALHARMHDWPIPEGETVDVPMGLRNFKEILHPPRSLAEKVYATSGASVFGRIISRTSSRGTRARPHRFFGLYANQCQSAPAEY